MNRLQDLQDKLFLDIQNIIQDLSEINSLETLLQDDFLIRELSEKTAFLKLSQAFDLSDMLKVDDINKIAVKSSNQSTEEIIGKLDQEIVHSEEENQELDVIHNQILAEAYEEEIPAQENNALESDFNIEDEKSISDDNLDLSDNEMFKEDIEEEEVVTISHSSVEEVLPVIEDVIEEEQLIKHSFEEQEESQFSFAMEKPVQEKVEKVEEPKEQFISEISISEHHDSNIDDRISEKEKTFLELESRRKQFIEENNHQIDDSKIIAEVQESKTDDEANAADKKIKLASIKGITKTLFDEEQLDSLQQEVKKVDSGSLISNNKPTNYMEAAKPKQEFRLDLNDKIAFTQHLFNNSQMDLNHVVNRLNSFDNLEEAKEFLSDLYYEKNWEKVDRFAQRLWILVENKFL